MATYVVRSKGKQYSVAVVDNATGGATVTIEDENFEVEFVSGDGNAVSAAATVAIGGGPRPVAGAPAVAPTGAPAAAPAAAAGGAGSIGAPIPGKILAVHVNVGDAVSLGDTVITLEAMKMENAVAAPKSGTVAEIPIGVGSEVAAGQLLMLIE